MTKLSQTQRAVLTEALERKDRCLYPITGRLKGGAVSKVVRSMLTRRLVEEAPGKGDATVWRHDQDGKLLTLRATKLAGQVLGAGNEPGSARVGPTSRRRRLRRQ